MHIVLCNGRETVFVVVIQYNDDKNRFTAIIQDNLH